MASAKRPRAPLHPYKTNNLFPSKKLSQRTNSPQPQVQSTGEETLKNALFELAGLCASQRLLPELLKMPRPIFYLPSSSTGSRRCMSQCPTAWVKMTCCEKGKDLCLLWDFIKNKIRGLKCFFTAPFLSGRIRSGMLAFSWKIYGWVGTNAYLRSRRKPRQNVTNRSDFYTQTVLNPVLFCPFISSACYSGGRSVRVVRFQYLEHHKEVLKSSKFMSLNLSKKKNNNERFTCTF